MELVEIGAGGLQNAIGWLRLFDDQAITIVDAVGFDLTRRCRITSCWSIDRHLSLGRDRIVIRQF